MSGIIFLVGQMVLTSGTTKVSRTEKENEEQLILKRKGYLSKPIQEVLRQSVGSQYTADFYEALAIELMLTIGEIERWGQNK